MFKFKKEFLVTNYWVTYFPDKLDQKNFGKISNPDLDIFLYSFLFKTTRRLSLLYPVNCESDILRI